MTPRTAKASTTSTSSYDARHLQVLEGLEAVRKRPGMYIGSTDSRGLMHCLWEIIDNSVDEALGGFGQSIDVTLHPDGSVEVEGSVPIRELNRACDWNLPDEEATTIAGLVIHEARAIPDTGTAFNFHGFRFQVLRKARNRITALRITPLGPGLRKVEP